MDAVIKPQLSKCLRELHLPAFVSHHAAQAALAANDIYWVAGSQSCL